MEKNWAAEHLQTIRTLMERSAIYRRALAPVSIFVGVFGIIAAAAAQLLKVDLRAFATYWLAIGVGAVVGALMLVRKQAIKQGEAFWSPPTRRVGMAMIPALTVGLVAGLAGVYVSHNNPDRAPVAELLVIAWTILYGLALHAAGFFMQRGIRLFGWGFIVIGLLLPTYLAATAFEAAHFDSPHIMMGIIFGASHLAYGIYLYFTEPGKNEA